MAWAESFAIPGCSRPELIIPFKLVHGIPIVELSINGHKRELFTVDSGSERTLIDIDEAKHLNLKVSPSPSGVAEVLGNVGGQPIWAVSGIQLKSGRFLVGKGDIFATTLFKNSNLIGIKIAGALGFDLLKQHLVAIDYADRKVEIYGKCKIVPDKSPNIRVLHLDSTAKLPVIAANIAIDGTSYGTARAVIDTGAQSGAMIYSRFSATHHLGELQGWKTGVNYAVSGFGSFLHGLPGSINMDGELVEDPDVSVSTNTAGLALSERYDALIGGLILCRWSLIFDVQHGKLFLFPATKSDSCPTPN